MSRQKRRASFTIEEKLNFAKKLKAASHPLTKAEIRKSIPVQDESTTRKWLKRIPEFEATIRKRQVRKTGKRRGSVFTELEEELFDNFLSFRA